MEDYLYGGLLLVCALGPMAVYAACRKIRKMWTGESRLDPDWVGAWRIILVGSGFPLEWAARHVPTQAQLNALVTMRNQGQMPIIRAEDGKLVQRNA